jgi:hypothetical protein
MKSVGTVSDYIEIETPDERLFATHLQDAVRTHLNTGDECA